MADASRVDLRMTGSNNSTYSVNSHRSSVTGLSRHSVFQPSSLSYASERRQPSISLQIYPLLSILLYPCSIFFGPAMLMLVGQNAILASAPSLFYLIAISGCSAVLSAPLLLLFNGLLDHYLSEQSWVSKIAHGLLYLSNLLGNIHLTAFIAASAGHHIMSTYTIYAIYGAGFVPALLCCLALAWGIRHFNRQQNTELGDVYEHDSVVVQNLANVSPC